MMSLFLVIIALNIFLSSVEGVGKLVVCKVANPTSFCQEKGGVRHQTNQHRPKTHERPQNLLKLQAHFPLVNCVWFTQTNILKTMGCVAA